MRRLFLALILALTTACVSTTPSVADRLFCGLSIPGGGEVTEEQWRAFVREEVTPRFPDGLTLWRAEGQWRGEDGEIVREPVLVIEIVHPRSLAVDAEVNAIAEAYKRRFRQEAVLRVTTPARLEFID